MLRGPRHHRRRLIAGGSAADHGDTLVLHVHAIVPGGGVEQMAFKAVHAFNHGHLRAREEADARDDGVELVVSAPFGPVDDSVHLALASSQIHRGHFGVEDDIAANVETVRHPFEIFEVIVTR